jgi:hypothetical protein
MGGENNPKEDLVGRKLVEEGNMCVEERRRRRRRTWWVETNSVDGRTLCKRRKSGWQKSRLTEERKAV